MVFKNKKEGAIGGNYKVKSIKVFGSRENLFFNEKKYRRVYDEAESSYLYCELAFFNKLFDEENWEAEVRLVCQNLEDNTQLCDLKKKIEVLKEENIIYVREGWGTPEPGWWRKGRYRWSAYIDNNFVGEALFYIVENGLVTAEYNPYFEISAIRMFESPKEGLEVSERNNLKVFGYNSTRYINVELTIQNLLTEEPYLPLEFQFNFYNDSGQHKAYMEYFTEISDKRGQLLVESGYGSQSGGYWFKDKYTLEVVFMDQLVAVIPFEVGEEDVLQDGNYLDQVLQNRGAKSPDEVASDEKPTFEQAKAALEALIGLESVKNQINEIATYLQFLKLRKNKGIEDSQSLGLHSVFVGNPGTGKTTVAHLLGQIFRSLDLLSHGKVHEVGRAELVGEFIGQTAPKVKKAIEKARGGILFIDEAYALTDRGDDGKDFGKEVLEVLIKELSDGAGDLAIIFAGYPDAMKNFLQSNPGLESRLKNVVTFPDYTPDELMQIVDFASTKKAIHFDLPARDFLHTRIVELYRKRDKTFGNARLINGVVEECKQNMALRLMKLGKGLNLMSKEKLSTIELKDVEKVFTKGLNKRVTLPIDEALLQDALTQLHALVGVDNIKKEVDELAKLARYYREIGRDVGRAFSLHTVFKGNPGTGKTTIARIIVQIYKALGILERGHLVEVDRKDLVAAFVGQTAIKTGEVVDKAIGGGLFIDEAYALTSSAGADFGKEAIEILLKRMEDQRGEFMVIVAGYTKEMDWFLEANPGLMSRFDKQFLFPDYTYSQLFEIANMMFAAEKLTLNEAAAQHLANYIAKLVERKHQYFGNARTVRKIVEQTTRNQHLRMANLPAYQRTEELVRTVTMEDVQQFTLIENENKGGIGFKRQEGTS